ncbi:MAG TPA: hypothetical protein VK907_07900, partial [Phnomibacter sp.]|nr:hypothetical protein [Phnomibacter sp.]
MNRIKYISNLMAIPALLLQVKRQIGRQQQFLQQEMGPLLHDLRQANDGSLDAEDFSKIEKYYGLAVPALLGEAYAMLRGSALTEAERRAATWLGATTGLFDDLFDRRGKDDAYIEALYRHAAEKHGANDNERLFTTCISRAMEHAASSHLLLDAANRVHRAQIESRVQQRWGCSPQQVQSITFEKGGSSVLFYMSVFYSEMPPQDQELYYRTGALLQLENDLFDVYKDREAGICTLVTMAHHIHPVRDLYLACWQQVGNALAATRYAAAAKKRALRTICAIVSRGLVCL